MGVTKFYRQFRFNIISCTDFMEKLLRSFEMKQMTYKGKRRRSVIVFSIEALHGEFREQGEWGKNLGSREPGEHTKLIWGAKTKKTWGAGSRGLKSEGSRGRPMQSLCIYRLIK